MIASDLRRDEILQLLPTVDGIDPLEADETRGYLRVGEWVALPVNQVNCRIEENIDPEILDEAGQSIGTLCLTSKLSDSQPNTLTKWQYVAYLADVDAASAGNNHNFKNNYVILNDSYLDEYIEFYYNSAPLWGGFSHKPITSPLSREKEKIIAKRDVIFPTRFHDMAFGRYVSAGNGFERFLRLYHTIELIFDFVIFKSIQKLGDDMHGFGVISRAYGKTEIDRLRYILSEYCFDPARIAEKFELMSKFEPKAISIFQDHTKDGNPLTAEKWTRMISVCQAGQTTEVDFIREKLCDNTHNTYARFVYNVSSYWIYRVRSSIAHTRVSEFLFEDSDEDFIIDFAEELLIEVVHQLFSSPKLKHLMT